MYKIYYSFTKQTIVYQGKYCKPRRDIWFWKIGRNQSEELHPNLNKPLVQIHCWGREKIASIFSSDIFKYTFLSENCFIPILPEFAPNGPVDFTSPFAHLMAWHRTRFMPISQSMMTYFTDIYASLDLEDLTSITALTFNVLHWRNDKCNWHAKTKGSEVSITMSINYPLVRIFFIWSY